MDTLTQSHLVTLRHLLAYRLRDLKAELDADADEMAAVEAALHRLDANQYGDCMECGEPMGLQRLLVQPAAARCAACQSVFELGGQRTGAR